GEYEGFARKIGIDVPGELFGHGSIEGDGNNRFIKFVDLELDFIWSVGKVDLAGAGIYELELLAFFKCDSRLAECRCDLNRWFMIDEVTVHDPLAIGIFKNRGSEYIDGVKRRRCGQSYFYCIKVFKHPSVFRDVIVLATERQFRIGQFAI